MTTSAGTRDPTGGERAPGTTIDHYIFVRHLTDGAHAELHLARDTRSDGEVVLKFPKRSVLENPALAIRWRREVALTERLDHPFIARRLDIGDHHSEPYVALEFASAGSLGSWVGVGASKELPVGQALAWGLELAEALAYLHDIGVIHRDIKPENVVLGEGLEVKLTDFGAAVSTPGARRWWQLPAPPEGTADYIAPEQVTGSRGDERTDVYQWGIMMYELLTGRLPFTGPDDAAIMQAHLLDDPVPIRDLRPHVAPALEAVVMTAMRRFPEHRQSDAGMLVEQLRRLETLDTSGFDLRPEPPIHATPGGTEMRAFVKLATIIGGTFVGAAALLIVVSALVH